MDSMSVFASNQRMTGSAYGRRQDRFYESGHWGAVHGNIVDELNHEFETKSTGQLSSANMPNIIDQNRLRLFLG